MAGDEEDELEDKQGGPEIQEITEEQQEAADEAADKKTQEKFDAKSLDTTDDFTADQFKAVAKKGPAYITKIKRYGAVSRHTSTSILIFYFFTSKSQQL